MATFTTTPRTNFRNAVNKIRRAAPSGSLTIFAMALRTNQFRFLRGDARLEDRPGAAGAQD
jgi:hypothetical protein